MGGTGIYTCIPIVVYRDRLFLISHEYLCYNLFYLNKFSNPFSF